MVTLFDQEKVMEIHDYNVAMENRMEERENGIRVMVSTLQELSIEPNVVAQKLEQQYGLSPQVAAAKVEQYWI